MRISDWSSDVCSSDLGVATVRTIAEMTERAVRSALGLLIVAMVLLNAAAAAGRYLFGDGLVGSDELMVFGMIWVVFIGAALLEREGRHLSFDLLLKQLGRASWRERVCQYV